MPEYTYVCNSCSMTSSITHRIDEIATVCPSCGTDASIRKVPSIITVLQDRNDSSRIEQQSNKTNFKPGEIVKSSINEIQQDVANEKENLKKRMWKP